MLPSRLLVRGVNWLGDAVMSTPALLRLRERFPESQITLLTHEKLADLWKNHPALSKVLTFAAKESVWRVGHRLHAERFDLSLIFTNSPRSAWESFLARIPRRVGLAGHGRTLLLTQPVAESAERVAMHKRSNLEVKWLARMARTKPRTTFPASAHQLHHYLHLVSAIGADRTPLKPELSVGTDEVQRALNQFEIAPDSPASPLLGLNAGAEYGPAKRWPQDRFASVAMNIARQTNCRWLLFGSQGDMEVAKEIASWLESVASAHPQALGKSVGRFVWNLAGQTSLRELCALLKACRLLLTNDSGPMHVAAAVGTGVVVPFGSTSPELTGPGLAGEVRHRLLLGEAPCAPCFRRECPIDLRCMNSITVEDVTTAVLSTMAVAFKEPK